jgi:hypothetical protein
MAVLAGICLNLTHENPRLSGPALSFALVPLVKPVASPTLEYFGLDLAAEKRTVCRLLFSNRDALPVERVAVGLSVLTDESASLDQLDLTGPPGLFEPRLKWTIETQDHTSSYR